MILFCKANFFNRITTTSAIITTTVGIITTAVGIITTAVGIITTAVGIDSHRGANQFPPLAESQGTYAVGCCPVGCCPVHGLLSGGLLSGGLLSGGLLSGGLLSGVRLVAANFHRGAVADPGGGGRGCASPPRIFDASYYVTPCPKLRDLGASHARLCLYTVGQTTDVHPPPFEISASAPGVARLRPL